MVFSAPSAAWPKADSFPEKKLQLRFFLPFAPETPLLLSGLETSLILTECGQEKGAWAHLRISGLSFDTLLNLQSADTTPCPDRQMLLGLSGAELQIQAGDKDQQEALSLIFHGKITSAQAFFEKGQHLLEVSASANLLYDTAPLPPVSYASTVSAAQVLSDLCSTQGITLEKTEFSFLLSPPFSLNGSFLHRVRKIAGLKAGFFALDPLRKKLSIGQSALPNQDGELFITPDSLIGLPSFSQNRLVLPCFFQPHLALGQRIFLQSSAIRKNSSRPWGDETFSPPWQGRWRIIAFTHFLSSEKPNGPWKTEIFANR